MKKAIRDFRRPFGAILVMVVISVVVAVFILAHQRFNAPSWVPFLGKDLVTRQMEFTTGKALMPGQGQQVEIAGVPIGEISTVQLKDGRALVSVQIQRKYDSRIMRDANALVRPKTGLEDMTIQLDPGTRAAGHAPDNFVIPISETLPTVESDEILSQLDADTRDYLKLLVSGAGEGLNGNQRALSNTFRRFDPTGRDLERISGALATRHAEIRRAIHNFSLLSQAIGTKDDQLSQLVDSSNAVFSSFAAQDANIRRTLSLLPGALSTTRVNLGKADRLARVLGPSARALIPFAQGLAPALRDVRPFLRQTTPVIKNHLRPFTIAALPVVRPLRAAAQDLSHVAPDLTSSLEVVNELLNELAYNPPGPQEGYLFWEAWANHDGDSVFSTQDAQGPIRRGLFLAGCNSLGVLQQLAAANPVLGTILNSVGVLTQGVAQSACPSEAGPGATPPSGSGG